MDIFFQKHVHNVIELLNDSHVILNWQKHSIHVDWYDVYEHMWNMDCEVLYYF